MLGNRKPLFRSALLVTAALLGVGVIGSAQNTDKKMPPVGFARPLTSNLLKTLREPIEMESFKAQNMKLREFIALLYELMQRKGIEIPIMIDYEAFKQEAPDTYKEESDLTDVSVKFPQIPKKLALDTIIRIAISRLPTNNGTFLVRKGIIEITTVTRAAPAALMQTGVNAVFDQEPLGKAVEELAETTGATIIVDPRIGTKSDTKVSANFVNGVPLKTALGLLADMTGLKMVELEGALYLTTTENAEALRKERKAQQEEELWRKKKDLPPTNAPPPPRREDAAAWLTPPASPFLRIDRLS